MTRRDLRPAFLFAGARNVTASLWEADDRFTTTLMKQFYTRLSEGQDVARALQTAKSDVRQRFGQSVTPYYWGPFVVVGEGRAGIRLKR